MDAPFRRAARSHDLTGLPHDSDWSLVIDPTRRHLLFPADSFPPPTSPALPPCPSFHVSLFLSSDSSSTFRAAAGPRQPPPPPPRGPLPRPPHSRDPVL